MPLTAGRKTVSILSAYDMFWQFTAGAVIYQGGLTELYQNKLYPAGTNGAAGIVLGKALVKNCISAAVDETNVRVDQGGHWWANAAGGDAIDANDIGEPCYAVDAQTVARTSKGGTLPVAGIICGFNATEGVCVLSGYGLSTALGGGAGGAAPAGADQGVIDISSADSWFIGTDNAALAAFVNAADPTPGLALDDAKAAGIRWNNHATPETITRTLLLPEDMDGSETATLWILAAKTGATIGDATAFTVGAFALIAGALRDADVDFGGDSSAMVGNAATKTLQLVSRTLAAADLPDGTPAAMTLTVKPKDGTLGTDDVTIYAMYLTYTRR